MHLHRRAYDTRVLSVGLPNAKAYKPAHEDPVIKVSTHNSARTRFELCMTAAEARELARHLLTAAEYAETGRLVVSYT